VRLSGKRKKRLISRSRDPSVPERASSEFKKAHVKKKKILHIEMRLHRGEKGVTVGIRPQEFGLERRELENGREGHGRQGWLMGGGKDCSKIVDCQGGSNSGAWTYAGLGILGSRQLGGRKERNRDRSGGGKHLSRKRRKGKTEMLRIKEHNGYFLGDQDHMKPVKKSPRRTKKAGAWSFTQTSSRTHGYFN